MVNGDLQHFTNLALEVFEGQKSSLDIKNMTPEQMTETARIISEKTQFTLDSMNEVSSLMQKTSSVLRLRMQTTRVKPTIADFLKEIGTQLCDKSIYAEEFKMGLAILKPFMKEVPGHPLPKSLEGPEWDLLKRSLLEKERAVVPKPPKQEVVKPRLPLAFPTTPPSAPQQPQLSDLFSGIRVYAPRQQPPQQPSQQPPQPQMPRRRFG